MGAGNWMNLEIGLLVACLMEVSSSEQQAG